MSDEDDFEKKLLERLGISDKSDVTIDILEKLTAKEVKIVLNRFGLDIEGDIGFEEIGRRFESTRKRIREIEEKALRKLRDRNPNDDDPDIA